MRNVLVVLAITLATLFLISEVGYYFNTYNGILSEENKQILTYAETYNNLPARAYSNGTVLFINYMGESPTQVIGVIYKLGNESNETYVINLQNPPSQLPTFIEEAEQIMWQTSIPYKEYNLGGYIIYTNGEVSSTFGTTNILLNPGNTIALPYPGGYIGLVTQSGDTYWYPTYPFFFVMNLNQMQSAITNSIINYSSNNLNNFVSNSSQNIQKYQKYVTINIIIDDYKGADGGVLLTTNSNLHELITQSTKIEVLEGTHVSLTEIDLNDVTSAGGMDISYPNGTFLTQLAIHYSWDINSNMTVTAYFHTFSLPSTGSNNVTINFVAPNNNLTLIGGFATLELNNQCLDLNYIKYNLFFPSITCTAIIVFHPLNSFNDVSEAYKQLTNSISTVITKSNSRTEKKLITNSSGTYCYINISKFNYEYFIYKDYYTVNVAGYAQVMIGYNGSSTFTLSSESSSIPEIFTENGITYVEIYYTYTYKIYETTNYVNEVNVIFPYNITEFKFINIANNQPVNVTGQIIVSLTTNQNIGYYITNTDSYEITEASPINTLYWIFTASGFMPNVSAISGKTIQYYPMAYLKVGGEYYYDGIGYSTVYMRPLEIVFITTAGSVFVQYSYKNFLNNKIITQSLNPGSVGIAIVPWGLQLNISENSFVNSISTQGFYVADDYDPNSALGQIGLNNGKYGYSNSFYVYESSNNLEPVKLNSVIPQGINNVIKPYSYEGIAINITPNGGPYADVFVIAEGNKVEYYPLLITTNNPSYGYVCVKDGINSYLVVTGYYTEVQANSILTLIPLNKINYSVWGNFSGLINYDSYAGVYAYLSTNGSLLPSPMYYMFYYQPEIKMIVNGPVFANANFFGPQMYKYLVKWLREHKANLEVNIGGNSPNGNIADNNEMNFVFNLEASSGYVTNISYFNSQDSIVLAKNSSPLYPSDVFPSWPLSLAPGQNIFFISAVLNEQGNTFTSNNGYFGFYMDIANNENQFESYTLEPISGFLPVKSGYQINSATIYINFTFSVEPIPTVVGNKIVVEMYLIPPAGQMFINYTMQEGDGIILAFILGAVSSALLTIFTGGASAALQIVFDVGSLVSSGLAAVFNNNDFMMLYYVFQLASTVKALADPEKLEELANGIISLKSELPDLGEDLSSIKTDLKLLLKATWNTIKDLITHQPINDDIYILSTDTSILSTDLQIFGMDFSSVYKDSTILGEYIEGGLTIASDCLSIEEIAGQSLNAPSSDIKIIKETKADIDTIKTIIGIVYYPGEVNDQLDKDHPDYISIIKHSVSLGKEIFYNIYPKANNGNDLWAYLNAFFQGFSFNAYSIIKNLHKTSFAILTFVTDDSLPISSNGYMLTGNFNFC